MEKKFNFVYLTTNLINGKQYIGDHSTNNFQGKTKYYLGSGLYLQNAIKKYGRKNFKRKILEFFPSKQEAFDTQKKWIEKFDTLSPRGYNLSPVGGLGTSGCFSQETLLKISPLGRHHSEETKQQMSKTRKGKDNGRQGTHHSEDSKQQIGRSLKGKRKGTNLSETARLNISKGKLGKSISTEGRKFIKKLKCPYCNNEYWPQNYNRFHGEKCKNKNL